MTSVRGTQNSSNFGGGGKRNFYYGQAGQSAPNPDNNPGGPVDMSTILLRQPFSPSQIQFVQIKLPGEQEKGS